MSLLHLLLHLPKPGLSIVAAHFNHRLRGGSSTRDLKFVETRCREWGVKFYRGQAPKWGSHANLEARARQLRFRFLKKTAKNLRIKKILLAHHADDQAETFLIHWLQGAGLRGLSGISVLRQEEGLSFVRPLLFISKREIIEYARLCKIPYRTDETNVQGTFLRNRVRKLLKALEKENPRLPERAAINSILLKADQEYLEKNAADVLHEQYRNAKGRILFPVSRYLGLHDAVRYRLLQEMAKKVSGGCTPLPAESIFKMDEILKGAGWKKYYDLPNQIGFLKSKVHFELFKKRAKHR